MMKKSQASFHYAPRLSSLTRLTAADDHGVQGVWDVHQGDTRSPRQRELLTTVPCTA